MKENNNLVKCYCCGEMVDSALVVREPRNRYKCFICIEEELSNEDEYLESEKDSKFREF